MTILLGALSKRSRSSAEGEPGGAWALGWMHRTVAVGEPLLHLAPRGEHDGVEHRDRGKRRRQAPVQASRALHRQSLAHCIQGTGILRRSSWHQRWLTLEHDLLCRTPLLRTLPLCWHARTVETVSGWRTAAQCLSPGANCFCLAVCSLILTTSTLAFQASVSRGRYLNCIKWVPDQELRCSSQCPSGQVLCQKCQGSATMSREVTRLVSVANCREACDGCGSRTTAKEPIARENYNQPVSFSAAMFT